MKHDALISNGPCSVQPTRRVAGLLALLLGFLVTVALPEASHATSGMLDEHGVDVWGGTLGATDLTVWYSWSGHFPGEGDV